MKKRVFVGIKIGQDLYHSIDKWRKKYQNLPIRWISNENLHVTLIPPWYEEEGKVGEIIREIGEIGVIREIGGFEISFSRICFGPTKRHPRLIWAEGEALRELIELKESVGRVLQKKPERRDYKLHLTLARFKLNEYNILPTENINDRILWKQNITEFYLFESRLSAKGAEYRILKEFK